MLLLLAFIRFAVFTFMKPAIECVIKWSSYSENTKNDRTLKLNFKSFRNLGISWICLSRKETKCQIVKFNKIMSCEININ